MKITFQTNGGHNMNKQSFLYTMALLMLFTLFVSCSSDDGNLEDVTKLPVLTGTVQITGTAEVGQTLTANVGSVKGSGILNIQWIRNGSVVIGNGGTYPVQITDVNSTITVTVERSGYSGSIISEPTYTVELPQLAGTVSITGIAEVGRTLTANTIDLKSITGTISYQWIRNGNYIYGANSSTYVLQAIDEGYEITVEVTRTNNLGYVISSPTDIVTLPPLTGTVSITGTARIGQTLTASTNLGGSGEISYQWKRNGNYIYGANSSTYVLQAIDEGYGITVEVTRSGYSGSIASASRTVTD
jgi:hypothetical protein